MKIGAPTLLLFLMSFTLAGLALAIRVRPGLFDRAMVDDSFWILAAAWVVLTVGVLKKGDDA